MSTGNINHQIEATAQEDPSNFWVFNNGITLLTTAVHVEGNTITLSGVAIINGAQTTGSLAKAASRGSIGNVEIQVRVIQCNDPDLAALVTRYNNTQNPIKAWELRASDPIQKSIQAEFDKLGITYQLRRSAQRRRATDVIYDRLGPNLSAFYGDPIAAHKNKAELFENEGKYRGLFSVESSVRNLLFIYRLADAVAAAKAELRARLDQGAASDDDKKKYEYFRYGAFAFAVMHACAEVLGLWLASKDPRFKRAVTFADDTLLDPEASRALLVKLVEAVLGPIHAYLNSKDAYQELKTQAGVDAMVAHAKEIVEQVRVMKPDNYAEVMDQLVLS
ncbi:MAG: AIPR family protein [Chloroflexi bacterium]|nr:AIPR family protein [Chloroflexota bacterium]